MTMLLMMLPVYLMGNLHCLGMCGPLVMMIGRHPWRYLYFLGRALSFSLAGALAGSLGAVLNVILQEWNLSATTSLLFGSIIFLIGCFTLGHIPLPIPRMDKLNSHLSKLILQEKELHTFLFGFFTVLLPCGQTLFVFSACALTGSAMIGFINGLAFALLTSPSLFFAMQAHQVIGGLKKHYNTFLGISAIVIGLLALFRGLAEIEVIPHLVLNEKWHLIIF